MIQPKKKTADTGKKTSRGCSSFLARVGDLPNLCFLYPDLDARLELGRRAIIEPGMRRPSVISGAALAQAPNPSWARAVWFPRELGQCCHPERDLESNFWAEVTAPDLAVRSPHPKTPAQA
jgi:hypothetical protein